MGPPVSVSWAMIIDIDNARGDEARAVYVRGVVLRALRRTKR